VSLDAMLSQPQVRRAGAGIDYQSKDWLPEQRLTIRATIGYQSPTQPSGCIGKPQPVSFGNHASIARHSPHRWRPRLGLTGVLALDSNIIEAPWLVNGGHGASFRHHNWYKSAEPQSALLVMAALATPTRICTWGQLSHYFRPRPQQCPPATGSRSRSATYSMIRTDDELNGTVGESQPLSRF
jgi:hypothetical protein